MDAPTMICVLQLPYIVQHLITELGKPQQQNTATTSSRRKATATRRKATATRHNNETTAMVYTSTNTAGRDKNSKNAKRKASLPVKCPAAGLGPKSAHWSGEGETPEENSAARRVDHTTTVTGKGKRPPSARVPVVRRQRRRRRRNPQTGTRRRRRLKPGEGALKEIRKMQRSTDLLISKAAMSRLVREIKQYQLFEQFMRQ
eukprot:scaffold69414_cov37-Attheya_sp.AAC.1